MSPEVLYSMLIGALTALFFGLIFGIPKFIRYIEMKLLEHKALRTLKQPIKRPQIHLNKKTITIALCVILGITVIVSTVALISTANTGKKEYTITFYNNKGVYFTRNNFKDGEERMYTKYQDNTIYKVEKFNGDYPSEPTPPTNEGYVFLGWYQNPECTDKFLFGHYEINSDINLYAKWGK